MSSGCGISLKWQPRGRCKKLYNRTLLVGAPDYKRAYTRKLDSECWRRKKQFGKAKIQEKINLVGAEDRKRERPAHVGEQNTKLSGAGCSCLEERPGILFISAAVALVLVDVGHASGAGPVYLVDA